MIGWHMFVLQMNSQVHTIDRKNSQLTGCKKSPWWLVSTLQFCAKAISLTYLFLFLIHLFITGRQHVFHLSHEVSDLFGVLKVHLIIDCVFFMLFIFPLKNKNATKISSFLPYFCTRRKLHHIQFNVSLGQAN